MGMEQQWWDGDWRGENRNSATQCHFVHNESHLKSPDLNPSLCCEKAASTHLTSAANEQPIKYGESQVITYTSRCYHLNSGSETVLHTL
jgi:hypothetical protein